MTEPYLAGVDPARWPEIRRRVAILDEYILIRRPAKAIRASYAERMGLSESQFMYLARIWRDGRDPAAIPGARAKNSVRTARRLPTRSLAVAHEVIDELGAAARRVDVVKEVLRRCQAEGVGPPSPSTITNMLNESRSTMTAPTSFAREILIDECAVKLPAKTVQGVTMPRLLLAIVLPERQIVAHAMGLDGCRPDLHELRSRLQATPHRHSLRVRAPHLNKEERRIFGGAWATPKVPSMGRVLGVRLGDLRLIYQASKARPTRTLVQARHSAMLSSDDVRRAIEHAIAYHNSSCPPLPPEFAPLAAAA